MKHLYLIITFPIIFLQRFIHKIFWNVDNVSKITENIFLGGVPLIYKDLECLEKNNIGVFINLATEFPFRERNKYISEKNGMVYQEYQVPDRSPVKKEFLDHAVSLIQKNPEKHIFIHCASGVGRSYMMTLYILIKTGICSNLEEAELLVKAKRPICGLHSGQKKILIKAISQ